MKKRLLKLMYTENMDLSIFGIIFVVVFSVITALCIDVLINSSRAYAVESEPTYTLNEIRAMGYILLK